MEPQLPASQVSDLDPNYSSWEAVKHSLTVCPGGPGLRWCSLLDLSQKIPCPGRTLHPWWGGTVGLYQASEWEYNWDSEAGTRSPWQPSEEGQLVRLHRVCLTAPVGTRRSTAAWEPGTHGMSSRLQQGGEAGALTGVTDASVPL